MSDTASASSAPAAASANDNTNSGADNDSFDTPKPEPKESNPKERPEPKEKAEVEPPKPKFRKVGDDMVDEDELVRTYQKAKGAEQKFREAAELRKSMESFMQRFREDPAAVLNDPRVPIDRKALAEKWLMEALEEEALDPRDRENRELRNKLKEREEQEKKAREEQEHAQYSEKVELARRELSQSFAQAIEKSPLSKDPQTAANTIREMALFMRAAKEHGETVTVDEALTHVQNRHFKSMVQLASRISGDDLIAMLGDEVINKIRKSDLARIRKQRGISDDTQQHRPDNWAANETPKQTKRIDPRSAAEEVRRKLGI